MSLISLGIMLVGLMVIFLVFSAIKQMYKLATSLLALLLLFGFVYTKLPDYWQSSINLTVALSTNGVFSHISNEKVTTINSSVVTLDSNAKFTWVTPVTTDVSNAPMVTKDNIHDFIIDFFTFDKKVLRYEIKCRPQDASKVEMKLKNLGISWSSVY